MYTRVDPCIKCTRSKLPLEQVEAAFVVKMDFLSRLVFLHLGCLGCAWLVFGAFLELPLAFPETPWALLKLEDSASKKARGKKQRTVEVRRDRNTS